ncbi:MAG: hypothetical protein HY806_08695 [Nitrospirae bacterium]|nr:hypothetical protein [Nitrospirota bacterium]
MRADKFRGGRALRKYVCVKILFSLSCVLIFLVPYPASAVSVEKGQKGAALSKAHIQKLKRSAEIVARALSEKGIKTVKVIEFTDIRGNPSAAGRGMSGEFKIHLASAGKKNFSVTDNNPEALIKGTVAPFKQGGKQQLKIIAVTHDKGTVITSYTGIFRVERAAERTQ